MYNGRGLSQLCTCTEGFECLRHGLEKRRGLFLSFSLSDTPHYKNVPFEVPESWVWTTLEEICLFLSRGKSPKYSDTDKTYPVFAQKCNLKEGGISLEQARFLDPSTICKWNEEYKLKTGDVLVNSTGTGTVGRTRLFHESYLKNYPFVVPDSHVSVIRTTSEVKSEFVFAYISSQLIQQHLEFCPCSIAAYIRRLSKTTVDYLPEVLEWSNKFCSSALKLLPYEIENEINPTHCTELPKVFNKGFCYFQNSNEKINLDENKIDTYIQTIVQNFNSDKISEIEHQINECPRETRHLIQGHFLADATMNYIRMRVKQIKGQSISLSNDAIYESIVDCKLNCSPMCEDKLFLKQQIEYIYHYYAG